ncbi:hypothetical protein [Haliangium sp.]|uniref:hypothetical protein n=1 Tax=Haliangium sp. TaxID=2663208 RepID=UPI003D099FAF
MSQDTYLSKLESAHDIEVFGEALYTSIARLTRDPRWREVWVTLAKLETQTKERLADRLRPEKAVREKPYRRWMGRVLGFAAAVAPRSWLLRVMVSETADYIKLFEELRAVAPPEDAALVDYIVAHEEAQAVFAREALAGASATFLAPVEALLER